MGKTLFVRRLVTWLAWALGLLVLWLLLVGTVARQEVLAGVAAAAIGATAQEVVRSLGLLRARLEWRWLRRIGRPLLRVVPEFLGLMVALLTRRAGTFRRLEFPTGGQRPADVGRRAFVTFAGSISPARLVVDADRDGGAVLVHELGGGGSSELP